MAHMLISSGIDSCAWGVPKGISVIYVLLPARKSRYMQLGRWDVTNDLAKWHTSFRASQQFTCCYPLPWIFNLPRTPLRYTVLARSCAMYVSAASMLRPSHINRSSKWLLVRMCSELCHFNFMLIGLFLWLLRYCSQTSTLKREKRHWDDIYRLSHFIDKCSSISRFSALLSSHVNIEIVLVLLRYDLLS